MSSDVTLIRDNLKFPAPYRRDLTGESLLYELELCMRNHMKVGDVLILPDSILAKAGPITQTPVVPWPSITTRDPAANAWRIERVG